MTDLDHISPPKPIAVTRLRNDLSAGTLFKIQVKNILLRILTLNIYSFWAKTRTRQYTTSRFLIDSDRFEYTGTVREAVAGFIRAVFVFGGLAIVYVVLNLFLGKNLIVEVLYISAIYGVFMAARIWALRYRLSRLRYRGIAFGLSQDVKGYVRYTIIPYALAILTLGFAFPWAAISSWDSLANKARYGQTYFRFEAGNTGKLWRTHLITWLLVIPTAGLSRFWYRAALRRFQLAGLSLGDLRFKSTLTGRQLLKMTCGNTAILFVPWGLGLPLVVKRRSRLMAETTLIGGDFGGFMTGQAAISRKDTLGDDLIGAEIDLLGAI